MWKEKTKSELVLYKQTKYPQNMENRENRERDHNSMFL